MPINANSYAYTYSEHEENNYFFIPLYIEYSENDYELFSSAIVTPHVNHHCCYDCYRITTFEALEFNDEGYIGIQPHFVCRLGGWCIRQDTNTSDVRTGRANSQFCSYRYRFVDVICLMCQRLIESSVRRTEFEVRHTWVPLPNAPGHAVCSNCGFAV